MFSITNWIKKGLKTKNLDSMLQFKKDSMEVNSRIMEINQIILELQEEKKNLELEQIEANKKAHEELDKLFITNNVESNVQEENIIVSKEEKVINSEKEIIQKEEIKEKVISNSIEEEIKEKTIDTIVDKKNNDTSEFLKKIKEINEKSYTEPVKEEENIENEIVIPSFIKKIRKIEEENIITNEFKEQRQHCTVADLFNNSNRELSIPVKNENEKRKSFEDFLNQ